MKKVYYSGNNKEFWKTELEYKTIVYPMDEGIRQQAEHQLGVKLPDSLIDLYRQQNGGETLYTYFDLPDGGERWITSFETIHFEDDDESLFSLTTFAKEEGIKGEFVALWSDYHHWLVLDYRNTKSNPSVVYVVENYDQKDITWDYVEIAPSFDDFLPMLYRKPMIDRKTIKATYKTR